MRELEMVDTLTIPATAAAYTKKTFLVNAASKWIPAALLSLFLDFREIFTELFYIILILWACDFFIGLLRAVVDPETKVEWIRIFRSVVKLVVIAIGVVAVHSMEHLLVQSGIETQDKLTVAMLMVVGIAESISVLDNLCYFFPSMGALADRLKELLKKGNGQGD